MIGENEVLDGLSNRCKQINKKTGPKSKDRLSNVEIRRKVEEILAEKRYREIYSDPFMD